MKYLKKIIIYLFIFRNLVNADSNFALIFVHKVDKVFPIMSIYHNEDDVQGYLKL